MRSLHRQRGFVRAGGGDDGGGDEPWPVVLTAGWMMAAGRLVARYKATVSSPDGQLYQVWWMIPVEAWRMREWRRYKMLEGLEALIRRAGCSNAPLIVQRRNAPWTLGGRRW